MLRFVSAACVAVLAAAPVAAAAPRDILVNAAFSIRDKTAALAQVNQAGAGADMILARAPNDREALLTKAMAIGYRAKLDRSRADALTARTLFDALATSNPRDPEAQIIVGGWHIDAVADLGGLIAGAALGAHKNLGLAAIDRAVALGGGRAMFPGLAGLLRLTLDPEDPQARTLLEAASHGSTPSPLDRIMQHSATVMLGALRPGNGRAVKLLAKQMLPFGRVPR